MAHRTDKTVQNRYRTEQSKKLRLHKQTSKKLYNTIVAFSHHAAKNRRTI